MITICGCGSPLCTYELWMKTDEQTRAKFPGNWVSAYTLTEDGMDAKSLGVAPTLRGLLRFLDEQEFEGTIHVSWMPEKAAREFADQVFAPIIEPFSPV